VDRIGQKKLAGRNRNAARLGDWNQAWATVAGSTPAGVKWGGYSWNAPGRDGSGWTGLVR